MIAKAESWRPVESYRGAFRGLYEVSNKGRVRGLKSRKILRQEPSNSGYLRVRLYRGEIKKAASVHRLVCEAFVGKIQHPLMVNHKDSVKTNNQSSNLEIVNAAQNRILALDAGLGNDGERSPLASIKDSDALRVWSLRDSNLTTGQIAHKCSVSNTIASSILRGLTWRRVTGFDSSTPKRKRVSASGTFNRSAKLTAKQVVTIRKLRSRGVKLAVLSSRYGVSESMISRIFLGKSWLRPEASEPIASVSDRSTQKHRNYERPRHRNRAVRDSA